MYVYTVLLCTTTYTYISVCTYILCTVSLMLVDREGRGENGSIVSMVSHYVCMRSLGFCQNLLTKIIRQFNWYDMYACMNTVQSC